MGAARHEQAPAFAIKMSSFLRVPSFTLTNWTSPDDKTLSNRGSTGIGRRRWKVTSHFQLVVRLQGDGRALSSRCTIPTRADRERLPALGGREHPGQRDRAERREHPDAKKLRRAPVTLENDAGGAFTSAPRRPRVTGRIATCRRARGRRWKLEVGPDASCAYPGFNLFSHTLAR